jgi:DNA-binding MarR family transcriptional regulator
MYPRDPAGEIASSRIRGIWVDDIRRNDYYSLVTAPAETHVCAGSHATLRALRGAAAHVERALSRVLEAHGLTIAQFAALQVLHEADVNGLTCSAIGQRLTGVAPDVTRLIDRLEAAGLVARFRDSNDRRVVHTRLTEKGTETLFRALPDLRQAEERTLAGLDETQRATLAALLQEVQRGCAGN